MPVFLADVKGDVSGLAVAACQRETEGRGSPNSAWPTTATKPRRWCSGTCGRVRHPVRTTVSEMGPTLLSRIPELNDTQSGVLDIVFKLADDRGLLLLDPRTCAPCSA